MKQKNAMQYVCGELIEIIGFKMNIATFSAEKIDERERVGMCVCFFCVCFNASVHVYIHYSMFMFVFMV